GPYYGTGPSDTGARKGRGGGPLPSFAPACSRAPRRVSSTSNPGSAVGVAEGRQPLCRRGALGVTSPVPAAVAGSSSAAAAREGESYSGRSPPCLPGGNQTG